MGTGDKKEKEEGRGVGEGVSAGLGSLPSKTLFLPRAQTLVSLDKKKVYLF